MKKFLTLTIVTILINLTGTLYALHDKVCHCNIDNFGNCLPCDKPAPHVKDPPDAKGDKPITNNICPCDIDAAGNCLPCDKKVHEETQTPKQ